MEHNAAPPPAQSPPRAAATRRRLPHRRGAVALEIEHAGHRYRMHMGFFADGAPAELFLDAAKPSSTLDAFAADAAILVSLLLQHGVPPVEIGHALRRSPNGAPASLIGTVVDELGAQTEGTPTGRTARSFGGTGKASD